jgi:hypothetical protein
MNSRRLMSDIRLPPLTGRHPNNDSTSRRGRRLLRCGISNRLMTAVGSKAEKLRTSKCRPVCTRKRIMRERPLARNFPTRSGAEKYSFPPLAPRSLQNPQGGRTRHHIASGRRSFLNVANISTKSKIPSGICDGILPARVKVRKGLGQMNRTHSLPPERWGEK